MLHSEPPAEFAEAIQAGYPTLKIFTTNILPSRSGHMIDFGDIWEAFQGAGQRVTMEIIEGRLRPLEGKACKECFLTPMSACSQENSY